MLNHDDLDRALELQARSYRLLKWMADGVRDRLIRFEEAHDFSTLPEAAEGWIRRHHALIPLNARVDERDLPEFAAFFATYLENSFDLVPEPGRRLYSPDAHCFCPVCSWLVDAPNLRPKKLTRADKSRARKMCAAVVRDMAAARDLMLTDADVDAIIDDPALKEPVSLVAYARELGRRLKGVATGPAVLALWRRFAWTEQGSPKPKFKLRTADILAAETRLSAAVADTAARRS